MGFRPAQLDWYLLDHALHRGVQLLVSDLNRLYRALPALHARDCEPDGFRWVVVDDAAQSVFAWLRLAPDAAPVVCIVNFTPVPRANYRIGLPRAGRWVEVLNTDAARLWRVGPGQCGRGHGGAGGRARASPHRRRFLCRRSPHCGWWRRPNRLEPPKRRLLVGTSGGPEPSLSLAREETP